MPHSHLVEKMCCLGPVLGTVSRSQEVDLVSFYFHSHFHFHFSLFYIFLFLKYWGLGLEVICHTVTSVTSDGVVTTLIMGLERRE